MAPWIMSSEVSRRPWRLTFSIGAIAIAHIYFENKKLKLSTLDGDHGSFPTVSAAMTEMHRLLNSPPSACDIKTDDMMEGYNDS